MKTAGVFTVDITSHDMMTGHAWMSVLVLCVAAGIAGVAAQSRELCANPDAFLGKNLQRYDCYKVLAAEEQCPAGCFLSNHEGNRYCSCQVTDSDSCLAKLTGELSYVRGVDQGERRTAAE